MAFANGTIGEIIKALDMAAVEMLAISLPDAYVIDATQSLVRHWNCTRYDMIGHQLSQSADGLLQARYIDVDLTGLGTQTATRIEVTFRPAGRQPSPIRFKPQLFRDGDREYLLLIAQPAEGSGKLAAMDSGFELAAKAGGYASWDYDFRHRTGSTDPRILRRLGLERHGEDLSLPDLDGRAHPDDTRQAIGVRLRELSGSTGVQSRYRLRAEDGSYVWFEVIAGIETDPLTGEPTKAFGFARDSSADLEGRTRAEASHETLARSQTPSGLGSWALDLVAGEFVVWSDQMNALLGLKPPPPPTFDMLRQLVEPEHVERWEDAIRMASRGQPVLGIECNFRHASGNVRRIITHIGPEFAQDGTVIRLHGICHDTTGQILLERRLLEARKMEAVGRLASSVAQDFDSLLENLLANLELAERSAGETDVGKRISLAIKAVKQGADLNKRILDLSRDRPQETETVDINAFLADLSETLRRTVGERISVSISPASEVWPCAADPVQLESALLDLANRARDAMADGGRLTFETGNAVLDEAYRDVHPDAVSGDYVIVAASDSGPVPSDDDGASAQPGVERALAAVRSFLAGAGGHLSVYAEPGFGTTVRLFLPRAAEKAEPSRKVEDVAQARRPVVLIVEDNDSVRDVAVAMVEEMNYEVLDAASGADALDVLRERNDINLLVSDVVMAGMSGPELVRQALKIRPGLKFLLASGYSDDALEEVQTLPEFVDLIQKPFTREELTEKVRNAVAA